MTEKKFGVKEAEKLASKAQGYLSLAEGRLLHRLAKECNAVGEIVEIGSWKGRSTIWIAFGSRQGSGKKVYAIDPHTGSEGMPKGNSFKEFKANISKAGVSSLVKPIVKTSEQAASGFREKAAFVFIDGNHDYGFARQDFDLWFPKVSENGVMAFHDTNLVEGPKRVVNESVFPSRFFRRIGFADSITFAEKVSQNSFWDRLRNRYVQVLKEFFTLASVVNLKIGIPGPLKALGKKAMKMAQ